ncbi:NAD(P)-binding protein [Mycena rosella]|uniref:NAD(P)-binding protein n=1 Tax=Mycena rosella TaxID=1033263 RepID=A0AAD7G681_MYCRO|nr:NAD(P)-binding protein [Mycena rosella]
MTFSTETSAPLVVIAGITGKQGGSVARALLESVKPYRIRGLTRDITKPAAQKFAIAGVQLVAVALTVGNEDGARAAFAGADVVFAVTNFNEHIDKEREVAEGKLMVDAAKAVDVKLFIWSALEPFGTLSQGRIPDVLFFDSKAEITAYAKSSGIPLAIVQAGYYATNIFDGVPYSLKAQPDGSFAYRLPMAGTTRVPLIDVEVDYGLYVRAAIELPALGAGSEVLSGRLISLNEIIADLAEVTGKEIVYSQIDRAPFVEAFPFQPLALTIADMCQAYEEIGYYGSKLPSSEDILARKPKSWREFLKATPKDGFPVEIRPA